LRCFTKCVARRSSRGRPSRCHSSRPRSGRRSRRCARATSPGSPAARGPEKQSTREKRNVRDRTTERDNNYETTNGTKTKLAILTLHVNRQATLTLHKLQRKTGAATGIAEHDTALLISDLEGVPWYVHGKVQHLLLVAPHRN
jgi:hypothetical protein